MHSAFHSAAVLSDIFRSVKHGAPVLARVCALRYDLTFLIPAFYNTSDFSRVQLSTHLRSEATEYRNALRYNLSWCRVTMQYKLPRTRQHIKSLIMWRTMGYPKKNYYRTMLY